MARKKKERARRYYTTFKKPLPNDAMQRLFDDSHFIGDFVSVNSMQTDRVTGALVLRGSKDVQYTVVNQEIEAMSMYEKDEIVIEKLKDLSNRILKFFGRKENDFILTKGVDWRYIENFPLELMFKEDFLSKLKDVIGKEKKIYRITFHDEKYPKERNKGVNLLYDPIENFETNRLLVEINDKKIDNVKGLLEDFRDESAKKD